ncbi:hypothetical protein MSP8886_02774 [Marinomonas spartinae]|uniref:DUF1240 domain-containing protein n=1 Tax=Marinomonas spartinae TaxID=1792290 RepID=A0A1A8TL76_9GAMM|nr:hypothetical protein [Marinomonas spartinae]SBS33507.1 hypothetical protein MSP8886_02774 [Marinomonas spartinae]
MKNRLSNIKSKDIWVVIAFLIMTLAYTWFMVAIGFNEVVQEIMYPYSSYPVVLHTAGELIILPIWILMWVLILGGVNHLLLTSFEKNIFKVFKRKLMLFLFGVAIISVLVFALDVLIWPISAKANGYFPCPYDTLLFGSKISTAWSKKEAYCYDKGVQARLTTGTFEQVVQVAKYLEGKKQ